MKTNARFIACLIVASLLPVAVTFGQFPQSNDPIGDIALEMHSAAARLAKLKTDKPTQETQQEVVRKLDSLIAELEKECAACRGASSANPSKPLADSVIKGGPGGIGQLHATRQQGDKWGELPPRERDRIMQSLTEGFPAHYQKILERYYKRLADEKPVSQIEAEKSPPAAKPNPATSSPVSR